MASIRDVIVVGAGLSGLMTGIQAARRGLSVLVIEQHRQACERFAASGMGAAPVSNAGLDIARFHGRHARFVSDALAALPPSRLRDWFAAIGVTLAQAEHYGHIIGNHVPQALSAALAEAGGELACGIAVTGASHGQAGFEIMAGGPLKARTLVLATGPDRSGAELAAALGHKLNLMLPAQVPLVPAEDWPRELAGLWMDVRLTLLAGERLVLEREGSLLFTPGGLSGEVVLNVSGEASQRLAKGEKLALQICFFPGMDEADVSEWMFRVLGEHTRMKAVEALDRMLPARLAAALLRLLKVKPTARSMHIEQRQREGLLARMLATRLELSGTAGMQAAESKRGGVAVREVNPRTFASRVCPGLFIAGSLLDVSADWGGFEQHFSLACGYLAGKSIRLDL
jgi:predicted Rossmann fold flavoprotein